MVDYEDFFWLDVEAKSSWLSKPIHTREQGLNRPAGYVGNFYGYPAILAVGGKTYGTPEEVWPTDGDIFLLKDPTTVDGIEIHKTNDLGQGTFRRGVVKRVNDEIMLVDGSLSTRQGTSGKDILIWDYATAKLEVRGEASEARSNPNAVVVSGRHFKSCFENNDFRKFVQCTFM